MHSRQIKQHPLVRVRAFCLCRLHLPEARVLALLLEGSDEASLTRALPHERDLELARTLVFRNSWQWICSISDCLNLRLKSAQHANKLWLVDVKDEFAFLGTRDLCVLYREAELCPVAERKREGLHYLWSNALGDS